jgi:predicted nicotinamide N-methyase
MVHGLPRRSADVPGRETATAHERPTDWRDVPEPARIAFIRRNTRLASPPLLPEMRLHLASESLPLWQSTEEELGAINLPPPFWAFAWAGGQALARYLLDHRDIVAGRSVVDLGAGAGLCAIAAGLGHARPVLAADVDPLACTAMRMNSAANAVVIAVSAEDPLAHPPPSADVVLAGDLFYEQAMSQRVLAWLEQAALAGALVLAGDPGRTYFPSSRFVRVAGYAVPVTRDLESEEVKPAAVWRLRGPRGA